MTPTLVSWTVLIACAVGCLRGLSESITMCKPTDAQHRHVSFAPRPSGSASRYYESLYELLMQFDLGARGHKYTKFYHAIDGTKDLLLVGLGVWLCQFDVRELPVIVALSGATIWAIYEPFYVYGRYGTFSNPAPEHITFLDLFHWYAPSWAMNILRLALVCGLMAVALS